MNLLGLKSWVDIALLALYLHAGLVFIDQPTWSFLTIMSAAFVLLVLGGNALHSLGYEGYLAQHEESSVAMERKLFNNCLPALLGEAGLVVSLSIHGLCAATTGAAFVAGLLTPCFTFLFTNDVLVLQALLRRVSVVLNKPDKPVKIVEPPDPYDCR